jgi:hypothetical protein
VEDVYYLLLLHGWLSTLERYGVRDFHSKSKLAFMITKILAYGSVQA